VTIQGLFIHLILLLYKIIIPVMNKTILITGASAGIGKAAAKLFAANGWNVIATMRSPEKETELTQLAHVFVTRLDVQDKGSIQQAISEGINKFGKIDVLLNNAGFGVFGAVELATEAQIRQQFDVNLFGVIHTMQAILPHFRANKEGMIINVSSVGGRIAFPISGLYHATKFAIEGLSESMSHELAHINIRMKIVEPGAIETSFLTAANVTSNEDITAYDDFVAAFFALYGAKSTEKTSAHGVAEVIYRAATDGTSQLRYVAGKDAEELIARQQDTEAAYMGYMRANWLPEKV
jgi:NAD(P)-dependent dehydrogenase (short-subunit alcohol dehydrogenase family)